MDLRLDETVFRTIGKTSVQLDIKAYVVGGYVRDRLLQRNSADIDVVVLGSGIEFAQEFVKRSPEKANLTVFKSFGTARVDLEGLEVEFVGARKESYRADSRKPIVEDGTLDEDLARRDFTINALAAQLPPGPSGTSEVIDLFGGLEDLSNKLIKTPLDPVTTYSDDPLRMLRAIRLASQLGFSIETSSFEAIRSCRERISIISAERIRDELNKIILSPVPSIGFKHLFNSGLLRIIFPEMENLQGVDIIEGKSHKDNFYHTLDVLDNVSRHSEDLWLRWAAILHDIAKPVTKRFDKQNGFSFHGHEDKGSRMVSKIFSKFHLPMGEHMKLVEKLVLLHLRPIVLARETVTDSAVRRLLFEAGDAIDSLMILCHSDVTTKNEYRARKYRDNFELVRTKLKQVEERDRVRNWQPPLSGSDIMDIFRIKEGREVGQLKNIIREAILDGEIANERDAALKLLLKKGQEMGLQPFLT